jgi:hypothetical protein
MIYETMSKFTGIVVRNYTKSSGFTYIPSSGGSNSYGNSYGNSNSYTGSQMSYNGISTYPIPPGGIVTYGGTVSGLYN